MPSASRRLRPRSMASPVVTAWRDGEGDRHVDGDAAVGGVLDGLEAHGGGGDLHDDVLGEVVRTPRPGRPGPWRCGPGAGRSAWTGGRCGRCAASKMGSRSVAASRLSSRTTCQPISDSVASGISLASSAMRGSHTSLALVDAGVGDGRVAGRADAAEGDGLGAARWDPRNRSTGRWGCCERHPGGGRGCTRWTWRGALLCDCLRLFSVAHKSTACAPSCQPFVRTN